MDEYLSVYVRVCVCLFSIIESNLIQKLFQELPIDIIYIFRLN